VPTGPRPWGRVTPAHSPLAAGNRKSPPVPRRAGRERRGQRLGRSPRRARSSKLGRRKRARPSGKCGCRRPSGHISQFQGPGQRQHRLGSPHGGTADQHGVAAASSLPPSANGPFSRLRWLPRGRPKAKPRRPGRGFRVRGRGNPPGHDDRGGGDGHSHLKRLGSVRRIRVATRMLLGSRICVAPGGQPAADAGARAWLHAFFPKPRCGRFGAAALGGGGGGGATPATHFRIGWLRSWGRGHGHWGQGLMSRGPLGQALPRACIDMGIGSPWCSPAERAEGSPRPDEARIQQLPPIERLRDDVDRRFGARNRQGWPAPPTRPASMEDEGAPVRRFKPSPTKRGRTSTTGGGGAATPSNIVADFA